VLGILVDDENAVMEDALAWPPSALATELSPHPSAGDIRAVSNKSGSSPHDLK
jgi:hypothetical protein